jgi:MFS transporter, DHA3 family, macrolide efflux protein
LTIAFAGRIIASIRKGLFGKMFRDLSEFGRLLANRSFSLYVFSYYLAGFGATLTFFAIWAQIYENHHSPVAIGVATMLDVLPGILIAPWAGALADRFPKRYLLIATNVLRAACVAGMYVSTELWQLYTVVALYSIFGAFEQPPHRALLPLLVRPSQYVTMNAFLATLNQFLQIFRPALGGMIVGAFGYKMAYAIDFWFYFLPAAALLFVRVSDAAAERSAEERRESGMWQEIREGVAYIRTEPVLLYLFGFMMLFTLAMGMQGALTYVFVGEYLAAPSDVSKVTGTLFSALGIGGLVGAFLTPRLIRRMSVFGLLFAALAFDGSLVLVFANSTTYWLALTCFAMFGIINSVIQIVQDTLVQTIVPEELRGRVYGAFGPITGPLSLLSVSTGTSLATVFGTRVMFMCAGLLEIGTVVFCRLLPSYKPVSRTVSDKFRRVV